MSSEPRTVAPGVRALPLRTPTLPPATHTNMYVLGERELIVVEPASEFPLEIDRAATWLESLCRADAPGGPAKIRSLVVTHHHPDHVGGAVQLRTILGAPLLGHPATIERLRGSIPFDGTFVEGDVLVTDLGRFDVIHTPGHAPGHVVFLDRTHGTMIVGDMVASVGTILVDTRDGDMRLYVESLARMRSLGPRVLLPAHGEPITNADETLARYIAHRAMREQKIHDALAALGPSTISELLPLAYDDVSMSIWPLAAMSLEAHLLKLIGDARVHRKADGRFVVTG